MGLFDAFKKKSAPAAQAAVIQPPAEVRYSEELIRTAIVKGDPCPLGCYFLYWDNLDEARVKKLQKNNWFPAGLQPLLVCHSRNGTSRGLVIGYDNVVYADSSFGFPGNRLPFANIVGCDKHWYKVTLADGSEYDFYDACVGKEWLREFFIALLELTYAVKRAPGSPAVPESGRLALEKNSVRRSTNYFLPEEMPPYLQAKLQRMQPDLPLSEVRGFFDQVSLPKGGIILTAARFMSCLEHCYDADLTQYDCVRLAPKKDPQCHFLAFGKLSGGRMPADSAKEIPMERSNFEEAADLANYQLALCHSDLYFDKMETEIVTREKAEFCYRIGKMVKDYTLKTPRYLLAEKLQELLDALAAATAAKQFDKVIYYYRLLTWNTTPGLSLRYWAYYSFMWEFCKPLSAVTVQRMFYYVTMLEGSSWSYDWEFFGGDSRLESYLNSGFYGSSLIDRRNELARRVNAILAGRDGFAEVPIMEGYALDYYMGQMQ